MARFLVRFAGLAMLLITHAACAGTIYTWPGVAPCDATLNACASAVAEGDTIALATSDPIDESLDLQKTVSLQAAPGYVPVFAAGRHIVEGGDSKLVIDGLTLLGGYIDMTTGLPSVTIRHVDMTTVSDANSMGGGGIYIASSDNTEIADTVVRVNATAFLCGICVGYSSATGTISIHDNRLYGTNSPYKPQLSVLMNGKASDLIYANQFFDAYLDVLSFSDTEAEADILNNAFLCTPEGGGLVLEFDGTAKANVYNNTVLGCPFGLYFNSTATVTGRIADNIVANTGTGLEIDVTADSAVTNDHNLFFSNQQDYSNPGPGTLTDDPLLAGDGRLKPKSPARHGGDPTALTALLSSRNLPSIDAAGLRRFQDSDAVPDIGAFAYGDVSLVQKSTGSAIAFDPDVVPLDSFPQSSQIVSYDDPFNVIKEYHYMGFKPVGGQLDLVRELDGNPPAAGSTFAVFVPGSASGAFSFTSSTTNISGLTTRIDNTATDGYPNRIVIAAVDGTTSFDHLFATVYQSGHWYVEQLDGVDGDDFPQNVKFNIYAQDPSVNAFLATVPSHSLGIALNHPVLNNEPCARFVVGNSPANPYSIAASYLTYAKAWALYNLAPIAMTTGAQFPVIVDEAGTDACRYDHLFHNGFEPIASP